MSSVTAWMIYRGQHGSELQPFPQRWQTASLGQCRWCLTWNQSHSPSMQSYRNSLCKELTQTSKSLKNMQSYTDTIYHSTVRLERSNSVMHKSLPNSICVVTNSFTLECIQKPLGGFGFQGCHWFWAYYCAFLGFYDKNRFIWGLEPGNPPKYAHGFTNSAVSFSQNTQCIVDSQFKQ